MLMNTHKARLESLRQELKRQGLDGFVIPISDEHMSEYVGAYAQRLAWLTGFGGSAGTAVVLQDKAAIFVDGRYTLQVRDQVDGRHYSYVSVPQTSVAEWLGENTPMCGQIGYDAWLHGKPWADAVRKSLSGRKGELVAVSSNPIDAVWQDRPAPSLAAALVHEDRFAGETSQAKRSAIAEWLAAKECDAVVITALDSIAWLLNIRGSDVEHTPVALSYVIANSDGTADLFIADEKVTPELRAHLGNAVRLSPREAFEPALAAMQSKRVSADPERAVQAIFTALEHAKAEVIEARDPTVLPKACKNSTEVAGHKAAQARDGAAVSEFLHWLSVEAPSGTTDELSVADKLLSFRQKIDDLRDLSFDTISGAGPNAAIPHYRVTAESSLKLEPNSIYLVDSGGQFPSGTTDITRTVWVGPDLPTAEHKDRFTRVLKGHIALDRAVFPQGTKGSQLDSLARQYLWAAGLDYAHGTGHGVGSFLAVHEGPQRIAKTSGGQAGTEQDLLPGMILSNEPGYYKSGEYGIRIENLVLVEERKIEGADGNYLGFETLTFVPIERRLVECSLLTRDEVEWWNRYHVRVLDCIGPLLSGAALAWLKEQCLPL